MHWLIVERYENWLVDRANDFALFGLPAKKLKLAESVKAGDTLIVYVSSKHSAFSDIREVISDGIKPIKTATKYDQVFEYGLITRSLVALLEDDWISIKELVKQLSFVKNKEKWGSVMLNSLRPLDTKDANVIVEAIRKKTGSERNFS